MQQRGFTLLELSVVLVIIGLMAGGVMMGRGLIRSAELNAVVTEYQTYSTAVKQFREKYGALPGDMPNAREVWGDAGVGCTQPLGPVFRTGTCDGNGDGTINQSGTGQKMTAEAPRGWQQLALAGLIEGKYTGMLTGVWSNSYAEGLSLPFSKFTKATWNLTYGDLSNYSSNYFFRKNYTNNLIFSSISADMYHQLASPVISTAEAKNIDEKLDDGRPGRGKVVALGINKCVFNSSNDTSFDVDYALTNKDIVCGLLFDYLDVRQGR